jgi:hypothetical protein
MSSFLKGSLETCNVVFMDGNKAIAGRSTSGGSTGIWYSTNRGISWNQSINNTTSLINGLCMSGDNAIATLTGGGRPLYSTNGGETWTQSTGTEGEAAVLPFLVGTKGIVGRGGGSGIFYTNDGGMNWINSSTSNGNISSTYMIGEKAVAGIASGNGIEYSSNSGVDWSASNKTNGTFISIRMDGITGQYGIAVGNTASTNNIGIWYSSTYGAVWNQSTSFNTTYFTRCFLVGLNGIACSSVTATSAGIKYTTDGGINWSNSNISSGAFNSLYMFDTNAIAGSTTSGIYISNNSGQNWTQTNINNINIFSVCMFRLNAIAGSSVASSGIYYNENNLCYGENIEILCLIDEKEVFVKITDLKKDMLVKTYKKGYKKITHYTNFNYLCMDETDNLNCLYKFKNKDVIMTGGHAVLVDDLTPEQTNNIYQFKEMIEDKHLLLSCLSDDFEKINDKNNYVLYHFVLENEDRNSHYGVYINDYILSESCSEKLYAMRFN